jgi:hypothetical protein
MADPEPVFNGKDAGNPAATANRKPMLQFCHSPATPLGRID